MPIKIKKRGEGFKVCDSSRCFSNQPLTHEMARKQQIAINLEKLKKEGRFPKSNYV